MQQYRIGFIGAGNMARCLAGGLLSNGWQKAFISLADPDPQQRQQVIDSLGLSTNENNAQVVAQADVLILAVKPQVFPDVCKPLATAIHQKKPLVISIAAGIRTSDIQRWLGQDVALVRAMPNTAALVGSGATGLYANAQVSPHQRDQAESILRAVGVTVWVQTESLMDVVTAVSGSGPAYFFLVMEALEQAAIHQGLDAATARLLTLETAFGAAKMALEGNEAPALLRQRVTSPGGTTERAIQVFEQGNLQQLFDKAVAAATTRGRELAELLGKA